MQVLKVIHGRPSYSVASPLVNLVHRPESLPVEQS